MPDTDNNVQDVNKSAADLERYVSRFENLEADKKTIADDQKALIDEVGSSGFDKKIFRKVIALRKRDPDDVANEEAIMDTYKVALKMA